MRVEAVRYDFYVLNMRTRMPFRYGIASLTALPHLFLRLELLVDGRPSVGIASEGLPPKWFTKDPDTTFEHDLAEMLQVIRHAAGAVVEIKGSQSVFDLWWELNGRLPAWGAENRVPALLSRLGTSLVERAVIDGVCRSIHKPFHEALTSGALGFDPRRIHSEIASQEAAQWPAPLERISVRHTVGLSDPIRTSEIPEDFPADGLPSSLEETFHVYAPKYLKIKLCGNLEKDRERLKNIAGLVEGLAPRIQFTVDGNEQFTSVAEFRQFWSEITGDERLQAMFVGLLFVEQPFHRAIALDEALGEELRAWSEKPLLIIDESDADLNSARRALDLGYSGVSHKNCKGVFPSAANALLLAHRRRQSPARPLIHSSEDLANVGPIALLQDLAVAAALGLTHSERNGHHYFRGLSMFPADIQKTAVETHPDLYQMDDRGFARLRITNGAIVLNSVNRAPFGCGVAIDPTRFTPLKDWDASSLDS